MDAIYFRLLGLRNRALLQPNSVYGCLLIFFDSIIQTIMEKAKPLSPAADHVESVSHPGKDFSRELEDINSIPLGWFVWMVACTASIAGLLFGYVVSSGPI